MAGSMAFMPGAALATRFSTKVAPPSRPVIPDRVHAKVRIRMAGTICLKPSGMHSVNSWKVITRRIM